MTGYRLLFLSFLIFAKYVTGSSLNASCTVSNYDDVATAAKSCDTLTLKNIVIPAKTTMTIALKDGAKLIFDGHITHVPAEWTGDLIRITGNNVVVSGTSSHLLDGLGPKHWKGANEPTIQRPKFIRIGLKNSEVKNLHLKNCPCACMIFQGSSNLVVSDVLIDNKEGYPDRAGTKFAKNTDGFDVSGSTNLQVKNSVVYNQDDCVAVNAGSHMLFENLWCNGSHGFSFTVKNGDVHDVSFKNCHMEHAGIAIHIKTHNEGSTGKIRNILYQNITFKAIDTNAISIQQNYPKGEAKGNIPITNLTLHDIKGTMTGSKSAGISIICAKNACSDWKWSGVEITGAKNKDECENVPSGIRC